MFYDHLSAHSLLAKLGRWDYIKIRPEGDLAKAKLRLT